MKTIRQDAWTAEDDLQLGEITLRHIREGSTQLAAFEETAERLNRTAAACGYRWNAVVRRSYQAAIEIAKAQRKEAKADSSMRRGLRARLSLADLEESEISWEAVLKFLKQYKWEHQQMVSRIRQLERENATKSDELSQLRTKHQQLMEDHHQLTREHEVITGDYKTLMKIMDRARRFTVLEEQVEKDNHIVPEQAAVNRMADTVLEQSEDHATRRELEPVNRMAALLEPAGEKEDAHRPLLPFASEVTAGSGDTDWFGGEYDRF